MNRHIASRLLLVLLVVATTATTAIAQTMLYEDFEDGLADAFSPTDGFWSVVDGKYVCDAQGYEYYSRSYAGDCSWYDYTLEFDIRVDAAGSINHMVFVRTESQGNHYEINVRGAPWNDIYLIKWAYGAQYEYLASAPIPNDAGEWHHYRIVLYGPYIQVEFDQTELFLYEDTADPYLCGGFALVGYSGSRGWQHAEYDNVSVSAQAVRTADSSWSRIKTLY